MKPNESNLDRAIRMIIGIISLMVAAYLLEGALQIVAIVVGVVGLITGITGFCGLYTLFGISTCPIKKN
jgi:hypothetical protein